MSRNWSTDTKQNGAILREAILKIRHGLDVLSKSTDDDLGQLVLALGTDQLDEFLTVADTFKAL